jgi:phenylacetate-CoA ligase
MIWIRGSNVFPSAVENVVRRFAELSSEYRIVVEGEPIAELTVQVEPLHPQRTDPANLGERVRQALREAINVRATVEFLPAGSLSAPNERPKPRRVIDRRRR